tara:strand:+ start:3930 stop:7229 length:3300 start_codon:yes stop_codon:yes gene_type:complete
MASVNKKFAVEKGLEVGENALVVDADNIKTGIGKTDPKYGLDVATTANFDGVVAASQVGIGSTQPGKDVDFNKDVIVRKKLFDSLESSGTSGTVLTSTGVGITWASEANIETNAADLPTQVQYKKANNKFGGASNFVYDATNSRVGIGSTQPEYLLQTQGGQVSFDSQILDVNNAVGAGDSVLSADADGKPLWVRQGAKTTNIIYVNEDGNDLYDGLTVASAKRTVEGATQIAKAGNVIRVAGGIYEEDNPVFVPRNVTIDGDDLRNTQIVPKHKSKDLFHVNNGVLLQNMSFIGAASTGAMVSYPPGGVVNRHRFVTSAAGSIVKTSWNSGVSTTPISADYDPTSGIVTFTTENPHGLSAPTSHSISTASYSPVAGILTVTTTSAHGFSSGDFINIADNSLTFRCEMDGTWSDHTYPRSTDPASNRFITATVVDSDTFTVNVGSTPNNIFTVSDATYEPTTGVLELTIGAHSLKQGESVKIGDNKLTFTCGQDSNASNHTYPRTTIDNHTALTGTTYEPSTGVVNLAIPDHGMKTGDYIKIDTNALTFTCAQDSHGSNHTYPRTSDPVNGKWIEVTKVDDNNVTVVILDSQGIPSTNVTAHTFVSCASNGIKQKRDRAYDQPVEITGTTGTTILLNVGKSSNTTPHLWAGGNSANAVTSGGQYNHTFITSTANAITRSTSKVGITTNALTFTCDQDNYGSNHTYPRSSDHVAGIITAVRSVPNTTTFELDIGDAGAGARYIGICTQSPYVRNCTNFVPNSVGMRIDGNHSEGIKSMVVDSYTQYNQGGIGVTISNDGYAQLVSIFTICDESAITCVSGGQCDVNNSNASFGNYGLLAAGVGTVHQTGAVAKAGIAEDNIIEVSGLTQRPYTGQVLYLGELYNNVESITVTNAGSGYTSDNPPAVSIGNPSGPGGISAEGVAVISGFGSVTAVNIFASGSQYRAAPAVTIAAPSSGVTATATAALEPSYYTINSTTPVTAGVSTITLDQNLPSAVGVGSTVPFAKQSLILASSYTFEYVGAGLTIGVSLPKDGGITIPENETVSQNGGKVVYTSTDERGNLKVGDGFTINQQTGTVTGDAFNKSIQATLTPLIIALGAQ